MKAPGTDERPNNPPRVWSAACADIPPGASAKFHILWQERRVEGFVVNLGGQFYSYVNYCAHAGTPLDWWPNEFMSVDSEFLICGTHGARYGPVTGKCAGGPCGGGALIPLRVQVRDDQIVITAIP